MLISHVLTCNTFSTNQSEQRAAVSYVELLGVAALPLARGGRRVGGHEALADGGEELVPLAVHQRRRLDDLGARRAQVGPGDHLRQRLHHLLQLRLPPDACIP